MSVKRRWWDEVNDNMSSCYGSSHASTALAHIIIILTRAADTHTHTHTHTRLANHLIFHRWTSRCFCAERSAPGIRLFRAVYLFVSSFFSQRFPPLLLRLALRLFAHRASGPLMRSSFFVKSSLSRWTFKLEIILFRDTSAFYSEIWKLFANLYPGL